MQALLEVLIVLTSTRLGLARAIQGQEHVYQYKPLSNNSECLSQNGFRIYQYKCIYIKSAPLGPQPFLYQGSSFLVADACLVYT